MQWDFFMNIYRRPGLVLGMFATDEGRDQRQTWLTLLGRLISELYVQGNYAILIRGSTVRLAFELSNDAQWLAAAVRATAPSAKDPRWSAQFVFRMDTILQRQLLSKLNQRPGQW